MAKKNTGKKTRKVKGGMFSMASRLGQPLARSAVRAVRTAAPIFKPHHVIKQGELHVAEVRHAAADAERAAHASRSLALPRRLTVESLLPAEGSFRPHGLMGSVGVRTLTYKSQTKYINDELIKLNLNLPENAPPLDSVKNTLSTWFTNLSIVDKQKISTIYERMKKWNTELFTRHIDIMYKILNITDPNILIGAEREEGPTERRWGTRNRERIIGILIRDFNVKSNKGQLGPDRYNAPAEQNTSIDHAFDILEMRRFASSRGITVESLLKLFTVINSPYFLNETGARFNSQLNGPTGAINKLVDEGATYEEAFRHVIRDTNYALSLREGLWRRNQFRHERFPAFEGLLQNDPVLNQILPDLRNRIVDPQVIPMPIHGGQQIYKIPAQTGGSKEEIDKLVNFLIDLFEINATKMQLPISELSPEQLAGGTRRRRRHSKKYRTRKH